MSTAGRFGYVGTDITPAETRPPTPGTTKDDT